MISIICISFVILYSIYKFWRYINQPKIPAGYKTVQLVSNSLPLLGHTLAFTKDPIAFIKKAYDKYGKVFKIKLLTKDMIVVCDRDMNKEFFSAKEENMSLHDILDQLYFGDAFSDDPSMLGEIIKLVKGTVAIKFDDFAPTIVDEANNMVNKIKKESNDKTINILTEMMRFVTCTSARCFVAIELSDEFYDILIKFINLFNKIIGMTYMAPKWLLRLIYNPELRRYRKKLTSMLAKEIETYRSDPNKNTSTLIRTAINHTNKQTGKKYTNEQVGDIIVSLLYVSSGNTAVGLSNVMIDLALSNTMWNRVRDESKKLLDSNDIRSLLSSPLLDSCIMESARMNSHIFALIRKPKKQKTLKDYYIGNADSVVICEPMLMLYDGAKGVFADPLKYNPDRFLEPMNESKSAEAVLTWGNKIHLCPGKQFAKYEMIAAMVFITTHFKQFDLTNKKIPLNFFSVSAFAERHVPIRFEQID
jgi:cytochrome P450